MIIDWFTVVAQVINFLILVWLLRRFLYSPILNAIAVREKRIATELEDAQATQRTAQQLRDEFTQKNQVFDQARTEMMNKAMAEAKTEQQRLMDAARKETDDLRSKWQAALQLEQQNLNTEITRKTQEEVFAITRKVLMDMAGISLETRMVELFVQRLRGLDDAARAQLMAAFNRQVRVRTTFALAAEQRSAVEDAVKSVFGLTTLQFELVPELVSGIELTGGGQKLAWSIAEYLGSLENSLAALLPATFNPKPDAVPEHSIHEHAG